MRSTSECHSRIGQRQQCDVLERTQPRDGHVETNLTNSEWSPRTMNLDPSGDARISIPPHQTGWRLHLRKQIRWKVSVPNPSVDAAAWNVIRILQRNRRCELREEIQRLDEPNRTHVRRRPRRHCSASNPSSHRTGSPSGSLSTMRLVSMGQWWTTNKDNGNGVWIDRPPLNNRQIMRYCLSWAIPDDTMQGAHRLRDTLVGNPSARPHHSNDHPVCNTRSRRGMEINVKPHPLSDPLSPNRAVQESRRPQTAQIPAIS